MLATGKKWFVDGTFQAVPTIFTQLVTFHTIFEGRPWPCLHALCSSKSQATYMLMYHNMKLSFAQHSLVARPRTINVDFELAMIQAIRIHYPNANIHGCYFHFCQAVYRKIQDLGLGPSFLSKKFFHIWVKKLNLNQKSFLMNEHFIKFNSSKKYWPVRICPCPAWRTIL